MKGFMMKLILLTLAVLSFNVNTLFAQTVTIYKQWHLSSKVNALDIEATKKLPQFENQKDIFEAIESSIQKNKKILLLSEGCSIGTEIDMKFPTTFNGWNMSLLDAKKTQADYSQVLAPIPMKVEAKYTAESQTLCADDTELMKKNDLALSDARGYLGFYMRLKEVKDKDPKKFQFYKNALEETENKKIADPVQYSKQKVLASLELFKKYRSERNNSFITLVQKHLKENPIIVIGGLHAIDLKNRLDSLHIKNIVITPKGYPQNSETLESDILKILK